MTDGTCRRSTLTAKAHWLAGVAIAALAAAGSPPSPWMPPIGIPSPSFGINESAPPTPNPWTRPTPGFYYVNRALGNDTGNPYGTPSAPRATMPRRLQAGSVVELHGTYDIRHTRPNGLVASGTAANPVFIRGVSPTTKPVITDQWEVSGSYFILENLEFAAGAGVSDRNQLAILSPADHAALRHSRVRGNLKHGGITVASFSAGTSTQVVIYNNVIHDNGDVSATFDQDIHGISVGGRIDNLWIVDNEIYRNSGDGIQINGGRGGQATTHHIYVGRNRAHGNKQTGMWTKQAVDVIFSQNESYNHRPGNSSLGACMGFQYAPQRVWFLFNYLHDCDFGIGTGSDSDLGSGTESYFIGNVIRNIHKSNGPFNPNTGWQNAAISLPGGVNRYVIHNTIYDADSGISSPGSGGTVVIANNIIDTITQPGGSHIFLEMGPLAGASSAHHNLFGGPVRIKWGSSTPYTLTGFQAAFPGQGLNSFSTDPLFVDPGRGNFSLKAASPAVNTGVGHAVYSTFLRRYGIDIAKDIAGTPRPQGPTMDIGAYERRAGDAARPPRRAN